MSVWSLCRGVATERRKRIALSILFALSGGLAAGAGEPPKPNEKPTLASETIDQPPAKESAQDNPLARSPGMRVATGPYVSIQVNVDAQGRNIVGDAANEPSISVNTINPSNMVIGWQQFNSVNSNFRQAGWAYTFNKGFTWTFPGVLTPGTFRSDPVLDVDSSGVFYYQSIKTDYSVDVFKSSNGGVTWSAPVPSFGGDKNWLAVDRTGGESNGYIYGKWSRYIGSSYYPKTLTRSVDSGASFEPPMMVPFFPMLGNLAVGPDGTIYDTGIDGTLPNLSQFVLAWPTYVPSGGGGRLVPQGRKIDMGGSMAVELAPNPIGLLGQANVAVDQSTGSTRGNVYVLASVVPPGNPDPTDVRVITSVDSGRHFSAPVRVNDDTGDNWQWMAAHAVAPNGRIDAIWFDTRDSGQFNISRLYYSYSWDAGATWSVNVPVSPSFNSTVGWPQNNKMGDYSTLVSDATGADVAYAATFTGGQDVYYVRLFPDCNGNGISDVTDFVGHVSLDCNLNHVPDECETAPACIGAGSVPDGGAVSGSPLTAAKGAGDTITLSWGASCVTADADDAVYEGTLSDFASHAPRSCSTGGALSFGLTPAGGSSYYLVVPVHADREGSYGTDGSGAERTRGTGMCAPQTLRACGS